MAAAAGGFEKLTRIWSDRREQWIAVRLYYRMLEGDCRIYVLERVEELD